MEKSNETEAELEPCDLLREMLRRGEQEVFPIWRKYVERFIDIFNSEKIQLKIERKIQSMQKLKPLLHRCENAQTVFSMMCDLKKILLEIESWLGDADPNSIFQNVYNTGFAALLMDKKLDFLSRDELSTDERVDEFLKYLEMNKTYEGNEDEQAQEEYFASFRKSRRYTPEAERAMREECILRKTENTGAFEQILNEVKTRFEPLRQKLVGAREKHGDLALILLSGANFLTSKTIGDIDSSTLRNATRANNPQLYNNTILRLTDYLTGTKTDVDLSPQWYNNTVLYLSDYLRGKITDDHLYRFLHKENLEGDIEHFKNCLNPWLNEIHNQIPSKSSTLPKELSLKEIDRMSRFLYAVVLNDKNELREHQSLVDKLIKDAGELKGSSLLPCISFGQLPLPGGEKERIVSFKFVLDSSFSHEKVGEVLRELKKIFPNVTKEEMQLESGANIIQLDVKIEENVPTTVARSIGKLADLRVRGILIGEFGLGGFRHAMNPAFNRIYSLDAVDKADGFIPTYFSGSLNRGGEPYYCPNGWRRYAIDVGLTGSEFETKYGSWHVAYHGTEGHISMAILLNGIRASGQGCFIKPGEGAVYLSPSIEYSGNPRYARVWKVKSKYVQMVLQVRVHKNLVFEKRDGTLPGAFPNEPPMNKNFRNNNELEWVIKWPPGASITALNGILVYGIMLRVTKEHPKTLPQNSWWGNIADNL